VLLALGSAQGPVVVALVHQDSGVSEVRGEVAGLQGGREEGETGHAVALFDEIVDGWLAVEADGGVTAAVHAGDHVAQGARIVVVGSGGDGLGREGTSSRWVLAGVVWGGYGIERREGCCTS